MGRANVTIDARDDNEPLSFLLSLLPFDMVRCSNGDGDNADNCADGVVTGANVGDDDARAVAAVAITGVITVVAKNADTN
jgi:hypothetical protein